MAEIEGAYIERIEAGFARIDLAIRQLDERLRQSEMRDAGFSAPTGARLDAAWRRVDEHSSQISELEKELRQLVSTVNQLQQILKWMLGIFSSLLVAVLIALATGHLSISMVP